MSSKLDLDAVATALNCQIQIIEERWEDDGEHLSSYALRLDLNGYELLLQRRGNIQVIDLSQIERDRGGL